MDIITTITKYVSLVLLISFFVSSVLSRGLFLITKRDFVLACIFLAWIKC